jgi:hypothetical protein
MVMKRILLCFLGLLVGNGLAITVRIIWERKYYIYEFWDPFSLFIVSGIIASIQMLLFYFIFWGIGKLTSIQLLHSNINFFILGALYAFLLFLGEGFILLSVRPLIKNTYIFEFFRLFLGPFIIFSVIIIVYNLILKGFTR